MTKNFDPFGITVALFALVVAVSFGETPSFHDTVQEGDETVSTVTERLAQDTGSLTPVLTAERIAAVAKKMDAAEEMIWRRFYSPATNLFYDYLTSRLPGEELNHLPRADEVTQQFPNDCGYGTGMEDCMISAGVMMTAVLDGEAYRRDRTDSETGDGSKTTSSEKVASEKAAKIFAGIERCLTAVPGEGFVARGVSPFAPGMIYHGTSRDQLTHAVAALWDYYRSPLADDGIRDRIRPLLKDVADRMIRNVTPENDYDFLNADGTRCLRGICKMEHVMPHEAARLAMIYAIAWDVTGEAVYHDLWREKIGAAARESLHPIESTATYGLLQMVISLDVLDQLEPDPMIQKTLREASMQASQLASSREERVRDTAARMDLTEFAPDWRKAGGLVDPYRAVWYNIRESGEIPLILLTDPAGNFPERDQRFLIEAIERVDFDNVSSCGVFDLLGAWRKGVRAGYFAPPQPER